MPNFLHPNLKKKGFESKQCQSRLASVSDALYVIGGKWKLRVIIALGEGGRRFNDLQRTVKGISARVLSNELKDLELNGFVRRTVHDNKPVVVEYELTDYSETLGDVLSALSQWGNMHRNKIRNRLPAEDEQIGGDPDMAGTAVPAPCSAEAEPIAAE